jgi:hypothetical protein
LAAIALTSLGAPLPVTLEPDDDPPDAPPAPNDPPEYGEDPPDEPPEPPPEAGVTPPEAPWLELGVDALADGLEVLVTWSTPNTIPPPMTPAARPTNVIWSIRRRRAAWRARDAGGSGGVFRSMVSSGSLVRRGVVHDVESARAGAGYTGRAHDQNFHQHVKGYSRHVSNLRSLRRT